MKESDVMTIKEKKDVCCRALMNWAMLEYDGDKDMSIHDEDIENLFTSRIILKKFEMFSIDIVLPDMLLLILSICVENNPGQFQIVLKDLLNSIKSKKGPIPSGYVITTDDFSTCFMMDYPITDIPRINKKYEELWDGQKKEKYNDLDSDNLCDTPEWWKEVMQ